MPIRGVKFHLNIAFARCYVQRVRHRKQAWFAGKTGVVVVFVVDVRGSVAWKPTTFRTFPSFSESGVIGKPGKLL